MRNFVPIFKSLLQNCSEKPQQYRCCLIMDDIGEGCGKLKIMLENELRTSDILTIPMKQLTDDLVSQEISYRINSNKQRTRLVLQRLRDVISILNEHNPAMLEVVQRAVSGQDPS